jgi:hypothetical protein
MRKSSVKEEGRERVRIDGMGFLFLAELQGRNLSPRPAEREGAQAGLLDFERGCVGVE